MPYITAAIILKLLGEVIPSSEAPSGGPDGYIEDPGVHAISDGADLHYSAIMYIQMMTRASIS
jgi:hypothetical protein